MLASFSAPAVPPSGKGIFSFPARKRNFKTQCTAGTQGVTGNLHVRFPQSSSAKWALLLSHGHVDKEGPRVPAGVRAKFWKPCKMPETRAWDPGRLLQQLHSLASETGSFVYWTLVY